jgi:hypothetical protein
MKRLVSPKQPQDYWLKLVSEFKQSGLSKKAFCNLKKLNCSTFHYWVYGQGSKADRKKDASTFIPVMLNTNTINTDATTAEIKISLQNGIMVAVTQRFDWDIVQRLIKVLKTC